MMKHVTLSFYLMICMVVPSLAQEVSVSMNVGYADDVYVSLASGEVETTLSTNWDLAFDVSSSFSTAIRINDGQGAELYVWPSGTIDDWSAVDTAGVASWTSLHNRVDSWDNGAFNVSPSGGMSDFSWGYYTGDPLHDVVGDSIYILKTVDEQWKKVKIELLDAGEWTFSTCNLDGTDEVQEVFAMTMYADRNFVYYSTSNSEFLNREPESAAWDLEFNRYFGQTAFGPGGTAGCLANKGIEIIQADDVDIISVDVADYSWIANDISVIGNDWKELNSDFMWEIVPNRCYFVKTLTGDIYKLYFTSFEGSSTGNLTYNTELISGSSISELNNAGTLNVYPNPASNEVTLALDNARLGNTQLDIFDTTGKLQKTLNIVVSSSHSQHKVDISMLPQGVYILQLINGTHVSTTRLSIQ